MMTGTATPAAQQLKGRLMINTSMERYSTWRAGGRAAVLFMPACLSELAAYIGRLDPATEVHFIGLGSNLLVRDGGVDGVVVRLAPGLVGIDQPRPGVLAAEAGVAAPKLARRACALGLTGAEFMVGIPGSIGGALAMNAGCFGAQTWELVEQVTVLARDGSLQELPARQFATGYRRVSHPRIDQPLFVAARFALAPDDGQCKGRLAEIMASREASQPIGTANAGSVFTNPPGDAAGRLIDAAGLAGAAVGQAEVSTKHANFIVNRGGATAADIEDLIELVGDEVFARTGVRLAREVRIIGRRP